MAKNGQYHNSSHQVLQWLEFFRSSICWHICLAGTRWSCWGRMWGSRCQRPGQSWRRAEQSKKKDSLWSPYLTCHHSIREKLSQPHQAYDLQCHHNDTIHSCTSSSEVAREVKLTQHSLAAPAPSLEEEAQKPAQMCHMTNPLGYRY